MISIESPSVEVGPKRSLKRLPISCLALGDLQFFVVDRERLVVYNGTELRLYLSLAIALLQLPVEALELGPRFRRLRIDNDVQIGGWSCHQPSNDKSGRVIDPSAYAVPSQPVPPDVHAPTGGKPASPPSSRGPTSEYRGHNTSRSPTCGDAPPART